MENYYWAALGAAKGIGGAITGAGQGFWQRLEICMKRRKRTFSQRELFLKKALRSFAECRKDNGDLPEKLREQCERLGISVVPVTGPEYPERLKQILRPPVVLYVKGTLPDCRYSIGMVGSRLADAYGVKVATVFSKALATAGVVVVSGGAKGIDSASHAGALQGGGKTVAVLGCGVDVVYPHTNEKLLRPCGERGACVRISARNTAGTVSFPGT